MTRRVEQVAVQVNPNVQSVGQFNLDAGVSDGSNAGAGEIGELLSASLAVGSATALTTNTAKNITSLVLTPGDWDVAGMVDFLPAATTSITEKSAGASTSTGAFGVDDTWASETFAAVVPTVLAQRMPIPVQRFSVSVPTTVFLVARAVFTASTMTAFGTIRARRVR